MFGSLNIGRVAGIDVFVHGTFWLLPLVVLLGGLAGDSAAEVPTELAVLFAVFGCVALHELGHAAAAAFYGIRTRDITLYPIGGVARLENMPDRAWPEVVVALAGPAVNAAVAAGLYGFAVAEVGPPQVVARVLEANLALVAFNLIPAFPMDGGRVFRAFVHLFTDRVTATAVAADVGGLVAGLILIAGLADGNLLLAVLAGVVFLLGRAELAGVRFEAAERRAAARWRTAAGAFGPWGRPAGVPRLLVPVDGWQWDGGRGEWVEYRHGYPVRRWSAG